MNGKKFKDMLSVANDIIANYISEGSEVAIVQFYTEATLVHDFVEIHVKADKAELIASLPDGIRGLGSIGDGIRMAISTLESKGSTTGSHIVLLTSGAETYHPYVADVHDEVISKGVLLSTLIFGENRNADLEALAEETDGVFAFNVNDFSLLKSLFQTYTDGIDGNQSERTVLVDKAFYKMSINDRQTGSATIDEGLGKDTVFQFEWSESWVGGEPMIQLTSPFGEKYCTTATADCSNELFNVDTHRNLAVFEIPSAVQGKWEYQITTTVHYQYVDMKITSKPVSSD
uniref:VWFA domain-containing protein n=1 Tax=Ciona savignyi TaxID=51511 RepID=H2ZKL8_CIOSA